MVLGHLTSCCGGHGHRGPERPLARSRGGHCHWSPAERGRGSAVPTWFLACLYRVCFKASESKVELSTSLTSKASSAALRRSSPFPKGGVGSKANRPPSCSSTHLHRGPGEGPGVTALAVPTCAPRVSKSHAQGDRHMDTRTPGGTIWMQKATQRAGCMRAGPRGRQGPWPQRWGGWEEPNSQRPQPLWRGWAPLPGPSGKK